jgi:hypothetical protein
LVQFVRDHYPDGNLLGRSVAEYTDKLARADTPATGLELLFLCLQFHVDCVVFDVTKHPMKTLEYCSDQTQRLYLLWSGDLRFGVFQTRKGGVLYSSEDAISATLVAARAEFFVTVTTEPTAEAAMGSDESYPGPYLRDTRAVGLITLITPITLINLINPNR